MTVQMHEFPKAARAVPAASGFTYWYRFADLPLRRFERASWAWGFWRMKGMPVLMWAGVVAVCFAGAQGISLLEQPGQGGAFVHAGLGTMIGVMALFGGLIVRWTLLQNARRREEKVTGYRAGEHRVSIDARGIRLSAAHCDCVYRWPAVAGVVQAKEGFLIMLGTEAWIPVPDVALPAGLTRDAALDLVHGWWRAG